jgi:hypothetical protein
MLGVCLLLPAFLGAQPAFSTNGLVAFYPFNSNANDESGNGLNGSVFGATYTTDRFGREGRALRFDGVDDWVAVTGAGLNISNSITLVGFLKYEGNNPNHAGENGIFERGIASNIGGYAMRLTYGGVLGGLVSNPYAWFSVTAKPLGTNRWYHFAMAYDGANVRMYLDGLLAGTYAAGTNRLPGSSLLDGYVLSIGRESIHYFWGVLDDLRLYNRALSDSEVGALYAYERYLEPTWEPAGIMSEGRVLHASALLPDGRVLVSGGQSTGHLANAELYYPSTNGWTPAAAMAFKRREHTLTLLDNGKVLAAGGINETGGVTVCELYDPATGLWSATGSLNVQRYAHTATKLLNGKVLVASGCFGGSHTTSAEIYDPATGQWTTTGSLGSPRCMHEAVLLPDGRVLVAGGYAWSDFWRTSEVYNPATGTWSPAASMNSPRYRFASAMLRNGKVLAVGGASANNSSLPVASAEVYDPLLNVWTLVGSMSTNRYSFKATLLPNGDVLVAGGATFGGVALPTAELFSPQSGQWTPTASMQMPRSGHTANLMLNGRILVTGSSPNAPHLAETFIIPPPRRATAVAVITNGVVASIRILDGGYGYSEPPVILIVGSGGSGATAAATVVNGVVTAITVTNPGSGYTSAPAVSIASPPFSPELAVEVSKVRVRLKVVLGRRYILESSFNLSSWTQVGDAFVAQAEELAQEFDVNTTGRFFRVQQVP